MPHSWTFPAPCKLNLFLHITGRRPDGYHNLETLFQLLDYGDTIEFEESGQISLQLSIPQQGSFDIPAEDNLVYKAAKLLAEKTQCRKGIHIRLQKNIPAGAGLGGGSSDAATTLLALNKIWQLQLGIPELSKIGLQLGADVPVFIEGYTSFAMGVGEQLTAVRMPENWFLVATPDVHISTQTIFSHPQLTRDTASLVSSIDFPSADTTRLFASDGNPLLTTDMSPSKMCALAVQGGQNDCQTVVEKLHKEVANLRKTLEKYAPTFMSGTGSSLFSQFEHRRQAEQVANKLANEDLKDFSFFIARGVNRSPVHHVLAD